MRRRLALLVLVATLPLALWAALPLASSGKPSLDQRIQAKQAQVERKRGHERVLTSDIAAYSSRIRALQGDIVHLTRRQNAVQADLDAKRAVLARLQDSLRRARAELARLKARLAHSRAVLAVRLRELYQADRPDIVTVILNSNGFADLLERGEFIRRINRQDARIITAVRRDKAAATTAARRLSKLETRQQRITTVVLGERNQVAAIRIALVDKRSGYAGARDAKSRALASTREQRQHLEEDLRAMQAQQARIQGQLGGSGVAGPIRQGSGQFIWPVNGPITSPFCERRAWEACHPGIDIGVPSGTPIRAAGSGTVAIAGPVSGYGNYTCIQHGGGLSTCYGHQSSIRVSVGQRVSQGQVIGLSGCTGLCFGPHLHFEVRVNGSVVNPMSYL
jgi:murein DD-endopeptidase MepM/ murein hydrolase activator NlpD